MTSKLRSLFAAMAASVLGTGPGVTPADPPPVADPHWQKRRAELHAGIYHRLFGRVRKYSGRRTFRRARKPYAFDPRYEALTGTNRHCYVHPKEEAVLMERNTQDKSYRVPLCRGCVQGGL